MEALNVKMAKESEWTTRHLQEPLNSLLLSL